MGCDGCYFEVRNYLENLIILFKDHLTINDASHCALHNTDTEPGPEAGG